MPRRRPDAPVRRGEGDGAARPSPMLRCPRAARLPCRRCVPAGPSRRPAAAVRERAEALAPGSTTGVPVRGCPLSTGTDLDQKSYGATSWSRERQLVRHAKPAGTSGNRMSRSDRERSRNRSTPGRNGETRQHRRPLGSRSSHRGSNVSVVLRPWKEPPTHARFPDPIWPRTSVRRRRRSPFRRPSVASG